MKKMPNEKIYLYGKNALIEALSSRPDVIQKIFLNKKMMSDETLSKLTKKTGHTVSMLKEGEGDQKVGKETTHQGAIAVMNPQKLLLPLTEVLEKIKKAGTKNPSIVVLGEIEDPHNVGAIIRSAVAFGASAVIIPEHNQAPITGTVVKTSVGMIFKIPVVQVGNINLTLRTLKEHGFWVYGLDMVGQTIGNIVFDTPSVFVVGNEGAGIREKTLELCDITLSIPIDPQCESLNAATATAITLYEWSKQK